MSIWRHSPIVAAIMSYLPLISCIALRRSIPDINSPSGHQIARIRIREYLLRFFDVAIVDILMNSKTEFAIIGGFLLGVLLDAWWCNPQDCANDDFELILVDMSILYGLYPPNYIQRSHYLQDKFFIQSFNPKSSNIGIQAINLHFNQMKSFDELTRNHVDLAFCKNYYTFNKLVIMDPISVIKQCASVNIERTYIHAIKNNARPNMFVTRIKKYFLRGFSIDIQRDMEYLRDDTSISFDTRRQWSRRCKKLDF
jgi:hypothetical protein